MAHTEADGHDWKKSSRSGKLGNSIHVAHLDNDDVLLKCDMDPDKVMYATGAEFAAFREAIKAGEFDSYGARTETVR
jgi:hypothetical protein